MKFVRKYWGYLAGILAAAALLGGAIDQGMRFDARYAKAAEVVEVSKRLSEHELRVERAAIWEYVREVEKEFRAMYIDEYGDRPTRDQLEGYIEDTDPDEYEIYAEAKARLEEIDEELEELDEEPQ